MPVTAKLSREFYEKFGDKIANELVEWFNQVDTTYRTELRDMNELNFQRLQALLKAELVASEKKIGEQLGQLRSEMHTGLVELDSKVDVQSAALRTDMATLQSDLIKWMFIFWVGTVVTLAGILGGMLKLALG
ncbi:MAG: hypothetical protein ACE5FJ_01195 [Gemmatimonadales bacterium]